MSKKLTYNIFVDRANLIHNNFYSYEHFIYVNNDTKSWITCPIHGDFLQTPHQHLRGYGCRLCGIEKAKHPKEVYNLETFLSKAHEIWGYLYIYDFYKYERWNKKSIIICRKHGPFEKSPHHHLRGQGCPLCALEAKTKSTEQFIIDAIKIHGDDYDYSEAKYKNWKSKIKIKCKRCGRFFYQVANTHLNSKGCPYCCMSHGERETEKYLKEHNLLFEREKKFSDCVSKKGISLRFDFYLPKYNICIEYDGIQHFKPQEFFDGEDGLKKIQENDTKQNKYCEEKNIKIIRIKYTRKVDIVLNEELLPLIN